jgi:acyl-CoA reductase-like NAD-dependent aldehyde dehydrogenase
MARAATTGRPKRKVPEREVLQSFDPATGDLVGEVPITPPDGVERVAEEVARIQQGWALVPLPERLRIIGRAAQVLLRRNDEIALAITRENGKTIVESSIVEVANAVATLDWISRWGLRYLSPERLTEHPLTRHKRHWIVYRPLGVVGVIAPWNYPFTLAMTPTVSALVAGNTVVLKPSEVTPLVGLAIGRLFAEVGTYPDIVQVVTGDGGTGDALVRSRVQKVAFTGSVRTGKLVMKAAAESLTPVLLELGGKDPMIVCDDADLDRAADGAVWGAFMNSGQTCMAVERVYVHEDVYDGFVDRVVRKAGNLRQGEGKGHDIGSMTFEPQLGIVERHMADARAKGAEVLTGGQRVPGRDGLWYEPTVLVDVDHSMAVMTEETFGPVLPIMKVSGDAEALQLANDSAYGLNSSVWSADADRARRISEALEAGNVCINDCIINYGVAALPFGGVKESGIGRVHGYEGLRAFSNVKSVLANRITLPREVLWYPSPRWMAAALKRLLRIRYRRGLAAKFLGTRGT